jgi:hypothetical protein
MYYTEENKFNYTYFTNASLLGKQQLGSLFYT